MDKSLRIGHLLLRGLGFAFSVMILICHVAISVAFELVDLIADSL